MCQCSVSIQCCCEPKIPRLRVIPATGDSETAVRNQLSPTPPPAYLDIYPGDVEDTQEAEETFSEVIISQPASDDENTSQTNLSPSQQINAADVR